MPKTDTPQEPVLICRTCPFYLPEDTCALGILDAFRANKGQDAILTDCSRFAGPSVDQTVATSTPDQE